MPSQVLLSRFEFLVQTCAHDAAFDEMQNLARLSDTYRGQLPGSVTIFGDPDAPPRKKTVEALGRLTDAITQLFCDSSFQPTAKQMDVLLNMRSWMCRLFSASTYGSTDHIVQSLLQEEPKDANALDARTRKQLVLYNAESHYDIDLLDMAERDLEQAIQLGASIVGSSVMMSRVAHEKRERMIELLPVMLDRSIRQDLTDVASLARAYMACSYSTSPRRHLMKRGISRLVREKLHISGLVEGEQEVYARRKPDGKPLMVVVLEAFSSSHSIFRTHSRTLLAARERFEVVAFCRHDKIDKAGQAIFDRFIPFDCPDNLVSMIRQVQNFARKHAASVLYMPSVGMSPCTICLANVRVAPIQIAALGHPAPTCAVHIDYMSAEQDFIKDPAQFGEKLMLLPADGQPYVPSAELREIMPGIPERGDFVNIAVMASPMKINPDFLDACGRIVETATCGVRFHFLTSVDDGLNLAYIRRQIHSTLSGHALVYGCLGYMDYLRKVNSSDMFLSPFPFGNTNGIVDALTVGLPGVNLRGAEVFERIDSALFVRAGVPSWLTTHSVDEYVRTAVRLAERHDMRDALRRRLIREKAVNRLFRGKPEEFGKRVLRLLNAQTANV